MQILDKVKLPLRSDAKDFINLYASLEQQAENFLPKHIFNHLKEFADLCHREADDPVRQLAVIDRFILDLKEYIPGYTDVSLLLFPHENSKAFEYSAKKSSFASRIKYFVDTESVNEQMQQEALNILNTHDYSVGTPPVTRHHLDMMYQFCLGDQADELRKYRSLLGIKSDVEESQYSYLMDVFEQMVIQSSHYTLESEKRDFLNRTNMSVNFKGLNGFIRSVVGGGADTAVNLISTEVFTPGLCRIFDFQDPEHLYAAMNADASAIFIVKIRHMRRNIFSDPKWLTVQSRLVLVDDSDLSRSTNTSMVFCIHNGIINTLDKVHTKILGSLANSQLNLRLILDKVNPKMLEKFRLASLERINAYESELQEMKKEQLGTARDPQKDIILYKFNAFARQIIRDKYSMQKLHDYLVLIQNTLDPEKLRMQNENLIREFEVRTKAYFYSNIEEVQIATIVEGGGRSQLRTYGNYLLQRKLKGLKKDVVKKCMTVIDIIPNTLQRTLKNHFHKNFGLNIFLERYREFITKVENESDNRGRFTNLLIDLGIRESYEKRDSEEQTIIREFLSNLANIEVTSIADDVQMIIRDIIDDALLKPYILFNLQASWEYKDIFPVDRFDINPFDLEIGLTEDKKIDFERLHTRLLRMKSSFQLFDDSGALWDRFCGNLTIIINDPSNPAGYTDFNNPDLIRFLKFLNSNKITLLLDEAYADAIKIDDPEEPKWRTISRYIMNNISSLSNISMVSSLSTTKNLGATGNRLGSIIATPARKDVVDFARKQNTVEKANTNSLYMLVNVLENAQLAKKIKDRMERELPKEASRSKIRTRIENYIIDEISSYLTKRGTMKQGKLIPRFSPFEGGPLHLFLLEELTGLDKLEVLELPDDFKYKGEPFFKYYQEHLVRSINRFRINKNFRSESNRRLKLAKELASKYTEGEFAPYVEVLPSDGSYLFNLQLKDYFSYQDLEKFCKRLAEERGIAVIPYQTGFLRFSMGGFVEGDQASYSVFSAEFGTALSIVLHTWKTFHQLKVKPENREVSSDDILDSIFRVHSDREYIEKVLQDYRNVRHIRKKKLKSLTISNINTLFMAYPGDSGVSINGIPGSDNAVFEFYNPIGSCPDLIRFIESPAFSKIYENLLPQIYLNIPMIRDLDYTAVLAKYGKATLLKYVRSKLEFQPDSYILDNPDEKTIMAEILLEMENILFSDTKTKIMALDAGQDSLLDRAKLEGLNQILRKYIRELLLHFNLPFDQEGKTATFRAIFDRTLEVFRSLSGIAPEDFNLVLPIDRLMKKVTSVMESETVSGRYEGVVRGLLDESIRGKTVPLAESLTLLFLLENDDAFTEAFRKHIVPVMKAADETEDREERLMVKEFFLTHLRSLLVQVLDEIGGRSGRHIVEKDVYRTVRRVSLFCIDVMNKTRNSEYYDRYSHSLIKFVHMIFRRQNSNINEMIQHGITLLRNFDVSENPLKEYDGGSLSWITEVMSSCGVIIAEQPVQTHTRIATDSKKRIYPFHKADRIEHERLERDAKDPHGFIKVLDTKPDSQFFRRRLESFIETLDTEDYRCKIYSRGLVKALFIVEKSYLKYFTDMYRLLPPDDIRPEDVRGFVPDIILFYGAPEKVISFPQIGYFNIQGPRGNIKTLVTPLKAETDYFGNIKKPWLTMMNEKVKEMGGLPVHGSLFAIESEDGSIFVVQVDGDSGVGKSEMLAAMMLKWLRKDLQGIRSIKLIAGDMFHVFPDRDGNLYGVGTEAGDFSRVTDFDPDFIRQYNSLFESAADSNVQDLNSRSTISGLCDITMPWKIDIMLTASNFAREEAGIVRYQNPENFLLYRDSHGERKEKATSSDNPHFQRTLLRYTHDRNIVEVLDRHGNYIDDVLGWETDELTKKTYICSTYRLLDRIDIEDLVNKIFTGKRISREGVQYTIEAVHFDIVKNRFIAILGTGEEEAETSEALLDREIFSGLFNSLASTPSGQPFVAEDGEYDARRNLVEILKGGQRGELKGRKVQLGILSTDLGRPGKEISGPRMAAEDLKKMLQEVRIANPDLNEKRNRVKQIIQEKYAHVLGEGQHSQELVRYNFFLYQLEEMKKAQFVRLDDMKETVDLSNVRGFRPLPLDREFSPLLVTPNINTELNAMTETYRQIMSLPYAMDVADEYYRDMDFMYVAEGYSEDTIVNNMIIQLMLHNNNLILEDLARGRIIEKVNRETLAAAKFAVIKKLRGVRG